MKIIIAGAGEVGVHLAKMLSQEYHDIVLMDPDSERLAQCTSSMEILPIVGDPTSLEDLIDCGVKNADLFVSVTTEEPINVTSCALASNLGARRTIARINNYGYLHSKNRDIFKKLGIDSMIYPEMLAAKEIVSAVMHPWTRQYWDLFDGQLVLVGVKVRLNSILVDKKLADLNSEQKLYHIVAIRRGNNTIIPRGNDTIEDGDIVFFISKKEHLNNVRQHAGKMEVEVKRIFMMGASRIAVRACQLLPKNLRIAVIDPDRDKCHRVAEKMPSNVIVIHGDARDTALLEQEGIRDAQAFVALTENSSTNILACLASKNYGVFKSIAQIENLDYIPMAQNMDIGTVINKKLIAASRIYQFLLDADVSNVKCLNFANAEVIEMIPREGSKITRKPVRDLKLPKDMTLGGLMRDGKPVLVNGDTQIQAGDQIMVFCLNSAMKKLDDFFN